MSTEKSEQPSQKLRDQLAAAIKANDAVATEQLLVNEPLLASADLRAEDERNAFTNGFPLFRACEAGLDNVSELLLMHGADPNAAHWDPDDQPEFGMPLHFAVHNKNYQFAHRLLDHGASPNGAPHCDQSTVELIFYHARETGLNDSVVRRAYACFLPERAELESKSLDDLTDSNASEASKLFARMVDLGGQPPFAALVREGFTDLVLEIAQHSPDAIGTPHDHPNSSIFNNIKGAARWYGYPELVIKLMQMFPERCDYESAIGTIGVAIGSHNRDGTYSDYRKIIVAQLEFLKAHGDLEEAREDPDFKPLHQIATDFTWHRNYGFRAEIARPECYIDLAELFVAWGFRDVNHRDRKSGDTPLTAAIKRGSHPGITVYIKWLLDNGATIDESAADDFNPVKLAQEKGHDEIVALLNEYRTES